MFGKSMVVERREVEGASVAWAVDGSPSDCVAFGIRHLGVERPFDLVVSGINGGNNVGEVAHYSGTVGAAMEGAIQGVPSMAVSMQRGRGAEHFELAADFAVAFATRLLAEEADATVVYSINVPSPDAAEIKGVVVAPMGGLYIHVPAFQVAEAEGQLHARAQARYASEYPAGSDSAAYFAGNITVTPLRLDTTDYGKIEELGTWGLAAPVMD
jgi:5'-nucleotidase